LIAPVNAGRSFLVELGVMRPIAERTRAARARECTCRHR
jgi:hypothetical protein